MKSWLRKLANSFSRKPEPAAETTWHAEDFQAAPDRPAVADPWAPDAAPNDLSQRAAPAPDAAPRTKSAPTDGLPPPIVSEQNVPAAEPARPAWSAAGKREAPALAEHAAPEPPPSRADPTQAAFEFTTYESKSADPAVEAAETLHAGKAEADDTPAEQPRADPFAMVAASDVAASETPASPEGAPLVQDAELASAPSGAELGWHGRSEGPGPFNDWDALGPVDAASLPAAPTVFHDDDFDLPEYDPGLSQRLGDAEWSAKAPRDSLARQRAAMIAALLDVTSRHEAETALQWLEAFFLEHRWSATFRALETAALEGLDFPTLRAMAALKDIWSDRPEWWLRRVGTNRANLGGTATERLPRGDNALSWRLARRICLARCDFPPEEMIDPDWLAEWFALLPSEPGATFFTAFLDETAKAMLAEALHEGLVAKGHDYEPPSNGHHRLAPRQPLPCGPNGEMVTPVMVEVTGQRQRRTEDDG